jgi:hypothetical protein
MSVAVGDVVTITVIDVAGYACWGVVDGQVGFVHCVEWSRERPIPEEAVPKVGDRLRVKVFRVVDVPQEQLPADVTFDGKFHVDFAGSVGLLQPQPAEESA